MLEWRAVSDGVWIDAYPLIDGYYDRRSTSTWLQPAQLAALIGIDGCDEIDAELSRR